MQTTYEMIAEVAHDLAKATSAARKAHEYRAAARLGEALELVNQAMRETTSYHRNAAKKFFD